MYVYMHIDKCHYIYTQRHNIYFVYMYMWIYKEICMLGHVVGKKKKYVCCILTLVPE